MSDKDHVDFFRTLTLTLGENEVDLSPPNLFKFNQ